MSPDPTVEQSRTRCYRPVTLADLRPSRAEPSAAQVTAAVRDVPVALDESQHSTEAFLPHDPTDRSIHHHVWLAFARARGHGQAAAEWAVYRLVEAGRVTVDRETMFDMMEPARDRALVNAFMRRVWGDGCVSDICTWDLLTYGRILRIVSTPALWGWRRAGKGDEPAAATASLSGNLDGYRQHGRPTGAFLDVRVCRSNYGINEKQLRAYGPTARTKHPDNKRKHIFLWRVVQEIIEQQASRKKAKLKR